MEFDFSREPGKKLIKENKKVIGEVEPKVSVVTPFYNAGKHFEQTYNCLINQTFEAFEWIIVNDGSTSEADVECLQKFVEADARIRLYHQENAGQSKAKNYGIAKATTDIIIFLDADDLIEEFYIELLYEALCAHPKASWSYTDLVGFAAQEYVWCKTFSAGRMTFNNILVNAGAFRKSAIEEVGGFPEVAKHYDEDWALYLQLMAKGMYPVHVPVIGFWYRKSSNGMQQTVRNNAALREESDRYIRELAKDVDIHVDAQLYDGPISANAVKSNYGMVDKLLAMVMKTKPGIGLVKMLYQRNK